MHKDLLQDDRRHWNFKKLFSNGHKGQEAGEEKAKDEQHALQAEEDRDIRVLKHKQRWTLL